MDELDWQECRACVGGNHSACAQLLKRHEGEIARQMWRFSRDRRVHEELVQEVMVEAYMSLPRYKRQGVPFVHWLKCIATRVGYAYWKRAARSHKVVEIDESMVAARAEAGGPSEAAALLHALLAELPAADRLVLTLMYFEECSLHDIAERAGWNIAMVKMRAYRARGKLKQLIESRNLQSLLMEVTDGRS